MNSALVPQKEITTKIGGVFLLPSNTLKIIVQYRPRWTISCVLPPDLKTVKVLKYKVATDDDRYDYDDEDDEQTLKKGSLLEIQTQVPSLLFSHEFYVDHTRKTWPNAHSSHYYLNAIDLSKEDKLWVAPYGFSNVADDGSICFGAVGIPNNLRAANILFWESPFNLDYSFFEEEHKRQCKNLKHEYYDHISKCCEYVAHSCKCKKNHGHYVNYLRHEGKYHADCACCKRICICSPSHKKDCLCASDACECRCSDTDCEHCDNKCECDACDCICCDGSCECVCACDMDDAHAAYIENYTEKVRKSQWLNAVNVYCGSGFLATPNKYNAVFISSNPQFLATVPQNLWRKDCNNRAVVIGFANLDVKTQQWTITIGTKHTCEIPNSAITLY